jgi:MHS family shikimate/dehydroshikimate transporter-like MFS transporter
MIGFLRAYGARKATIMTVAEEFTTAVIPDDATALRRIVWSSVIGTAVEWYDFLIYGAATALVFNKIFFAAGDAALATIAAFGTYAVGFLARPLGAGIFGHFGDRIGRKAMLAITIIVMGLGTFFIGLLPTYQQIGIAAPVLLIVLRFLQGIGLGGEWGGAVLMVVENCPTHRRGFLGSMVRQPRRKPGRNRRVRTGLAAAGERLHRMGMANSVSDFRAACRSRTLDPP